MMGCDQKQEITALQAHFDEEKVWVFIQFNVREETNGLESYYYYAEISKNIYSQMSQNQLNKGFILLENVKYWSEDDLIYNYADIENTGELLFRIEDIYKVDLINVEPIVGRGTEQFELKSEQEVKIVDQTENSNNMLKEGK